MKLWSLIATSYPMVQYPWVTKYNHGLFVGLLLETALVVLDVTCKRMYEILVGDRGCAEIRTRDFLLTIAGDGAEDGILLADYSV